MVSCQCEVGSTHGEPHRVGRPARRGLRVVCAGRGLHRTLGEFSTYRVRNSPRVVVGRSVGIANAMSRARSSRRTGTSHPGGGSPAGRVSGAVRYAARRSAEQRSQMQWRPCTGDTLSPRIAGWRSSCAELTVSAGRPEIATDDSAERSRRWNRCRDFWNMTRTLRTPSAGSVCIPSSSGKRSVGITPGPCSVGQMHDLPWLSLYPEAKLQNVPCPDLTAAPRAARPGRWPGTPAASPRRAATPRFRSG